jgi:hypothetical protein
VSLLIKDVEPVSPIFLIPAAGALALAGRRHADRRI